VEEQIKEKLKKGIAPDNFMRRIGLFSATTIGVGALMGGGIYVLIGFATDIAGPSIWLSFILCGAMAFLTTLVFSELGSKISVAGGGYAYSYASLGNIGGFATGWFLALGSVFACSLYALGFANYLFTFFSSSESDVFVKIAGSFIIVLLTIITVVASESNKIQAIFTWGNVLILLILCTASFFKSDASNLTPVFPNGLKGTVSAISVIYLSYFGYQLIANNSIEIKSPEKIVPRAMRNSMMIVWIIYVIVAIAAISVIPWKELASSDTPLTLVAENVFGGYGWILISFGGVLASAGALNSTLSSQGRQIYAMGKHRFFPDILGSLSKTTNTPAVAIIAGGAGATIAIWLLDMKFIAKSANFCLLASMIPVSLALRKFYNSGEIQMPKYLLKRFIPELALLANILMIFSLDWVSLVFGQQLALIGALIFLFYSRKREKRSKNAYHVVLSDEKKISFPLFGVGNKILMPMANPEHQRVLFMVSNALLSFNGGEIIALSIAKTPENKDMDEAMSWAEDSIKIISRSAGFAREANIVITPIIRASSDVAMGIVHAAEEEGCKLIVMGYNETKQNDYNSIMSKVLNKSKTDVIFLNSPNREAVLNPKKIAVSLAGRINLDLMVALANSLAESNNSQISFLSILPEKFNYTQRLKADRVLIESVQKLSANILYNVKLLKSSNPLEELIRQSEDFDLLIVGATKSKFNKKEKIGDFADQISVRAKCDVAVVRSLPVYRKILRVV